MGLYDWWGRHDSPSSDDPYYDDFPTKKKKKEPPRRGEYRKTHKAAKSRAYLRKRRRGKYGDVRNG